IRLVLDDDPHLDSVQPQILFVALDDMLEHTLNREQPRVQRADSVLEPRQIEQVPDNAIQPSSLSLESCEIALARGGVQMHVWHVQRLEVAEHRSERRLQLV